MLRFVSWNSRCCKLSDTQSETSDKVNVFFQEDQPRHGRVGSRVESLDRFHLCFICGNDTIRHDTSTDRGRVNDHFAVGVTHLQFASPVCFFTSLPDLVFSVSLFHFYFPPVTLNFDL